MPVLFAGSRSTKANHADLVGVVQQEYKATYDAIAAGDLDVVAAAAERRATASPAFGLGRNAPAQVAVQEWSRKANTVFTACE